MDESLNQRVSDFARLHRKYFHTKMHNFANKGHPGILIMLDENNGCTQKSIADEIHIRPASVTKMLQKLEGEGLIERKVDSEDLRISRVYLTDEGKKLASRFKELIDDVRRTVLKDFTDEEKETLIKLLDKAEKNLNDGLRGVADSEKYF